MSYALGCINFSYTAVRAFLSTDYFADLADKQACCDIVKSHFNPLFKVNCTQQIVLKIKDKKMGCGCSLVLQNAWSSMSTAGVLGSILPHVCTALPGPESQPPLPLSPPSHVDHSLGDYISFSLPQSVIRDISFREANIEGQKYPQASLFHP